VASAVASTEAAVLIWSAGLLVAQIFAQGLALDLAGDLGMRYLLGPRDKGDISTGVPAGRLKRALGNFLETYPAFIALVLALTATGKTGGIAAPGAVLWLSARAAYVVLYAAGIPVLRTLVWVASMLGLSMMLLRLAA
jgi:uncharacterized MAPEG superfamily protein